jgi:DNA topoisomerase I
VTRASAAGSPEADAEGAGLRYVSDEEPGLTRRRSGRGFTYWTASGKRVTDEGTLARIRALAIPPAWTDVWICRTSRGHIQATGRDARGRKQYRYHAQFRERRDAGKFDRLIRFGERLPRLRRRVSRDLRRDGLPREKVIAAVVRLMEKTFLRIGNEEYARLNRSFGLSTLRNRHVTVRGHRIRFRFRAKGGRLTELDVVDRRLAAVVRRCQDLPGQALFEFVDRDADASGPGAPEPIDSADVNDYIREALGDEAFSAKDLRTWAGTVLAFRTLRAARDEGEDRAHERGARDPRRIARVVREAIAAAAEDLGNTPAVARASYVHPAVLEAALDAEPRRSAGRERAGSRAEEQALLRVLRSRRRG